MRNLNKYFKNRKINYEKLKEYGFNDLFIYNTKLSDDSFLVYIDINNMTSKVIDTFSDEEYLLIDVLDTKGEFVGKLKDEYESIIKSIVDTCSEIDVFKSKQSIKVINYIKDKYGDELEYLWENSDTAIWRNKNNSKWYGALLIINGSKLGTDITDDIEIIDLRYSKDDIDRLVDNKVVFRGYHMNKKSWITIKLDNSMSDNELFKLIDNSYNLSGGSKSNLSSDNMADKIFKYIDSIPKNKVTTYKQIAIHLGNKGLARRVGTILNKYPEASKYPCHKVLKSDGSLSYPDPYKDLQKSLLVNDGIEVIDNKVDLDIYRWK